MYGHGSQVRKEWKIMIAREGGFGPMTEWRLTDKAKDELVARWGDRVLSVEFTDHVLDY